MMHASTLRYVVVWLALVALALLSFWFSRIGLGSMDTVVALGVAALKTALVLIFFMELIEHRFTSTLVILVSSAFVVLLIAIMAADVLTRRTFPRGPEPAADETTVPAHQQ